MAMVIQEFSGSDFSAEVIDDDSLTESLNVEEADIAGPPVDPDSLMVEIEGIHAYPYATRNYTRYMPKCLKNSVLSWTKPYRRPLIKHHNEKNGEIIGRVCDALYKSSKTLSGTPALLFTTTIPTEEAKRDVKNGNLETVSIGVIAHDVRCSICGQQLASGVKCEHERGVAYDGETCYWDIHSMEAKELSYVIVPSDVFAKNINMYSAIKSGVKTQISEALDESTKKEGEQQMENQEKDLTEAKATITSLETKVSELTEAKNQAETKVAELTEANAALKQQVTDLKDTAAQEATLKEGLESALEEAKIAQKDSMIETVQALRKAVGKKELDAEAVKNRSEASLSDTILDLKEELIAVTEKEDEIVIKPNSVTSPAITENEEDGKLSIKENNEENIDLEAGLENLFSGVVAFRR